MTTHVMHKDRDTTWQVDTDNDTWILAEDAEIKVENTYGINDGYHGGTTIKVLGDIEVKGGGYSAVVVESDHAKVVFGGSSRIDATAANGAVQGNGDDLTLVNHGYIKVAGNALDFNNGGTIDNFGTLVGSKGISASFGTGTESIVTNHGFIDALDDGIFANAVAGKSTTVVNSKGAEIHAAEKGVSFVSGGDGELTNRGTIKADVAVSDGNGSVTVINRGEMIGDIDLGAGNDTLDLRRGSLDGTAYGGEGADVYRVSSRPADLSEGFLGGVDTVESSARFTLGDNFEILELIGNRDVAARGNGLNNIVTGNAGDNKLFGMVGIDTLSGAGGNDRLEGGDGGDTFVFATGFGDDVIADFVNGADKIDLSDWADIANYADLMLGHMTIDGSDIRFESGSDSLRLRNVDVGELDPADFVLV